MDKFSYELKKVFSGPGGEASYVIELARENSYYRYHYCLEFVSAGEAPKSQAKVEDSGVIHADSPTLALDKLYEMLDPKFEEFESRVEKDD